MTQTSTVNWQALMIGAISVFAVIAYAFMVQRSTRYTVISMLILGSFAAFAAIVFGTVVLPYLTFKPKPVGGLRRYTQYELIGRNVYRAEGCWYCHTQYVREVDWDFGPASSESDYIFDSPAMLGSERTGPDLSNEGGKYPDEWHRAHHRKPTNVAAGSLMPPFAYLEKEPVHEIVESPPGSGNWEEKIGPDGKKIPLYVNDPKDGRRPMTKMDALIAYIQSLGTRRDQVTKGQELEVPDEYKFVFNPRTKKLEERKAPTSIPLTPTFANQGRGMFNNLCAPCHGTEGAGDGPAGRDFVIKPANFNLPMFDTYSDAKWFWRISNGVPGARMPAWRSNLSEEQIWYLVRYLQSIATPERVVQPGARPAAEVATAPGTGGVQGRSATGSPESSAATPGGQ